MTCLNCGSKIYEGDKFCGECGLSLEKTEATYEGPDNHYYSETSNAGLYFKEVGDYVKNVFIAPDKLVASRASYKFTITLGSLGLMALLVSFLTTLFVSEMVNTFSSYTYDFFVIRVPIIGTTASIFLAFTILLAAFYGLTVLLAKIIGRNLESKEIFTDYATTSIVMWSIYILGLLFGFIGMLKIFGTLILISFGLFMFTPLFILLRNTENHLFKFDRLYTSAIYFFVSVVVLVLALSIIDFLFGNNVGDIIDTLSIFDLFEF